ncbi:diguanylate cyclase (GGDEF) domain-containing protein [Papillibacter cinnamivorans DSM 12816]|uniref:Diguanylate cyclase (GGDEF) domain-containing protein n=2 Tax=Papillibacter TaxID=100175 RepID=A0A1W2BBA7_9FIRM|nr:diguanylate cyclase (GGDEF) domain-containing protein [Papillibacter cinnamivorans DSM 12816]
MNMAELLACPEIKDKDKAHLRRELLKDNLRRGRILAMLIIVLECIFIGIDLVSALLKVDDRFSFYGYFAMYSVMIGLNITFLVLSRKKDKSGEISPDRMKKAEKGLVAYITLILTWGSLVSLMDQSLYGNLTVFITNMVLCSIVFVMSTQQMWVPYCVSVLILCVGLPFFQSSGDILIGHYVNIAVFTVISWFASRMIYKSYCSSFKSKLLLNESNSMLEREIDENREINAKLSMANLQLKKLALLDELTGLPNRRNFRNYIDVAFNNQQEEEMTLSIIMIDIDYFKHFNDTYGHEEGDRILSAVAAQLGSVLREPMEIVCRWGGEEFLYAALNKPEEDIRKTAESIRSKVAEIGGPTDQAETCDHVSVSLGIAAIKLSGREDVRRAIEMADRALYLAKNEGRNCIRTI